MAAKFSIVIPTFNSRKCVEETVASALAQTYENLEVVVDDNISRDGTVEFLREKFGRDPHFRLFANPDNLNIPQGWNRGIARATGDYVLLLHADNLLHPRYGEVVVGALERLGGDVGYSECEYFSGNTPSDLFDRELTNPLIAVLPGGRRTVDYVFRFQRMIPTSAVTIRRTCFNDRPAYDPKFLWDPDIEQMTWLAERFRVVHVDHPLGAIRTHDGQAASWRDPTFSDQYRTLLSLANQHGSRETHQFLFNWARSNQDICEKLATLPGVSRSAFYGYLRRWVAVEAKVLGYFSVQFARHVSLALRLAVRRQRTARRLHQSYSS